MVWYGRTEAPRALDMSTTLLRLLPVFKLKTQKTALVTVALSVQE